MKKPVKLPIEKVFDKLPDDVKHAKDIVGFYQGIGVVMGIGSIFTPYQNGFPGPFLLEDYRMGMVRRGQIRGIINLREVCFTEGMMAFVTPGSIVEPIEVSDDFLLEGMGVPADKFLLAHGGHLPRIFNGEMSDGSRMALENERSLVDRMFGTLRCLLAEPEISHEIVFNMVATISNYYNMLFLREAPSAQSQHVDTIFSRFLRLVNLNCKREHRLAFYADKLCITERYLGTVVKQASGVGAKEWIDRALIFSAKVMLRHSDMQAARVADELCFPNASFFSKYFHRITGYTPSEYRAMAGGK